MELVCPFQDLVVPMYLQAPVFVFVQLLAGQKPCDLHPVLSVDGDLHLLFDCCSGGAQLFDEGLPGLA